jgi:hypothetical protein
LTTLPGRYEFQNQIMMVVGGERGRVYTYGDGLPDEEFVLVTDGRSVSTERPVSFKVLRQTSGEVEAIEWISPDKITRRVPRISNGVLIPRLR